MSWWFLLSALIVLTPAAFVTCGGGRRRRRAFTLGGPPPGRRSGLGVLVLALTVGALVATQLAAPAPAAAAVECAPEIVVGVDGTGVVGKPDSIVRAHTDAAAAAGARVYSVDYPGSVWPIGPYVLDQSVAMGVDATRQLLDELRTACPDSHVTGIGHSQGALVLGDAVEGMAADGLDTSDLTVVLLSDPRRIGGVAAVAPSPLPGYTFAGPRGGMGNADVVQVCRPFDPVCDFPPIAELWRVPGGFARWHVDYPLGYGDEPAASVPAPTPAPGIAWPPLPDLPPLPNLAEAYVERPLSLYVPVELRPYVPAAVLDFVPPPVPCVPLLTC